MHTRTTYKYGHTNYCYYPDISRYSKFCTDPFFDFVRTLNANCKKAIDFITVTFSPFRRLAVTEWKGVNFHK